MPYASTKAKYFQSTDLNIVGGLRSGDIIYHLSEFYDTDTQSNFFKRLKYIVQYTPVYFPISGNWSIRVTQKAVHEQDGKLLSHSLFVNHLCIHKYYFPESAVNLAQCSKAKDQLQSLLDQLNEPDFQICF